MLAARIDALWRSGKPDEAAIAREFEAGKMLGVLVAEDGEGVRHTLFAFSGQLGDAGFHFPGFVGPVFDYLQPDGRFKTKEAEISAMNIEISRFEKETLAALLSDFERAREETGRELDAFKENCLRARRMRKERRESGPVDADELARMIRQSQFEKAELHRMKKRRAAALEPRAEKLREAQSCLQSLKDRRKEESETLQRWLFDNFLLLNARGESRSLNEIFAGTPMKVPPSGAGECCAPKLLQEAYLRGWTPVAIAEFWYGKSKGGEVRVHGCHYPACRGKCLPVLGWMLRGLDVEPPLESDAPEVSHGEPEIVFENEWFCVVEKPAGMLAVPGKGHRISVQDWLGMRYGAGTFVKMAHRLDRDTSGLIVAALTPEAYKVMQSLFATRKVRKTYVADLFGDYVSLGLPRSGHIELPLSPDWLDRPRQIVDFEEGKEAVTDYEFDGAAAASRSRVRFYPRTGRTHQLRVHAASAYGLGMPIVGDRLYGRPAERLHLHAHSLEFTFPLDGHPYSFLSPVPF